MGKLTLEGSTSTAAARSKHMDEGKTTQTSDGGTGVWHTKIGLPEGVRVAEFV